MQHCNVCSIYSYVCNFELQPHITVHVCVCTCMDVFILHQNADLWYHCSIISLYTHILSLTILNKTHKPRLSKHLHCTYSVQATKLYTTKHMHNVSVVYTYSVQVKKCYTTKDTDYKIFSLKLYTIFSEVYIHKYISASHIQCVQVKKLYSTKHMHKIV